MKKNLSLERFKKELKRKEVLKICGGPWKSARFSNPETTQSKQVALDGLLQQRMLKKRKHHLILSNTRTTGAASPPIHQAPVIP